MSVLAWIPARGGSKGIAKKNLRVVGGRPLVSWAIDAATDASLVDRVVVSTDDNVIAAMSAEFGAEVVDRPPELSQGDKPDEALEHTLGVLLEKDGYVPDIVLRLPPTNPLRGTIAVDSGVWALFMHNGSAVGLVEPSFHPYRFVDVKRGRIKIHKKLLQPRQRYEPRYAISGVFLGAWLDYWRRYGFFGPRCLGLIFPRRMSIDIDEELDLEIADALLQKQMEATVST